MKFLLLFVLLLAAALSQEITGPPEPRCRCDPVPLGANTEMKCTLEGMEPETPCIPVTVPYPETVPRAKRDNACPIQCTAFKSGEKTECKCYWDGK